MLIISFMFAGGIVSGFTFLIGLGFLNGRERIAPISDNIIVLADYYLPGIPTLKWNSWNTDKIMSYQ